MPIDAEAYMGGAIPALSRGGSWLPLDHPSSQASGSIVNPSMNGAYLAGPSSQAGMPSPTISASSPSPFFAGVSMAGSFAQGLSSRAPMFNIQLPPAHPGWRQAQSVVSPLGVPSSAVGSTTPGPGHGAPMPSPSVQSAAHLHLPVSPSLASAGRFRDGSYFWGGGSWEHASGSPKKISPESDYARSAVPQKQKPKPKPIHLTPHRRRADSLPSPPSEIQFRHNVISPLNPLHQASRIAAGSARSRLSGVAADERERTTSGSGKRLEARRADLRRPALGRSYSSHQLNTVEEQSDRSGHQSRTGKASREIARDHAKRSPPAKQDRRAPRLDTDIVPSSLGSLGSLGNGRSVPGVPLSPGSPYRKLGRSLKSPLTPSPKSPYIKLNLKRPAHTRRHTSAIEKATTSTHGGSSGSSSDGDRDRREHPPSLPPTPRGQSRYDLESLSAALPHVHVKSHHPGGGGQSAHSSRGRTRYDSFGYVPPLGDDGYDRYTAHPAAPTPSQRSADHQTSLARSAMSAYTGQAGESPQQQITTYLPVGYARPTKDVEWNRDGPAMKTHGVAWKKHKDDLVLPPGPAGPRWEQARPPRIGVVAGGGWTESGGQGM